MIAVHPPKAKKISQNLEIHGDIRTDNYYWLRNRDQDEVLEYLRRENEYYHALTAHTSTFQDGLFSEMKARIKEDDESVPYKQNGYWYLTRFEKGREYPV
jgi:oligopeptidase B